jgi:flavin-binding protein dodecin
MDHHVYKIIELTGTSPDSVEKAVEAAVQRASETLKHLRWFEVTEVRGAIKDGRVAEYQVSLKVGFSLHEPGAKA